MSRRAGKRPNRLPLTVSPWFLGLVTGVSMTTILAIVGRLAPESVTETAGLVVMLMTIGLVARAARQHSRSPSSRPEEAASTENEPMLSADSD